MYEAESILPGNGNILFSNCPISLKGNLSRYESLKIFSDTFLWMNESHFRGHGFKITKTYVEKNWKFLFSM
jgi:hypothetical protein